MIYNLKKGFKLCLTVQKIHNRDEKRPLNDENVEIEFYYLTNYSIKVLFIAVLKLKTSPIKFL